MQEKFVNVGQAIRWPGEGGRDTVRGFGTVFEYDTDEANDAIRSNVAMLPLSLFEAIGFTDEELARYKSPGTWETAPADFMAKLRASWAKLHEYRESLKGDN